MHSIMVSKPDGRAFFTMARSCNDSMYGMHFHRGRFEKGQMNHIRQIWYVQQPEELWVIFRATSFKDYPWDLTYWHDTRGTYRMIDSTDKVRKIQRFVRGWIRQSRMAAVAMSLHSRLGEKSPLSGLDSGIIQCISEMS